MTIKVLQNICNYRYNESTITNFYLRYVLMLRLRNCVFYVASLEIFILPYQRLSHHCRLSQSITFHDSMDFLRTDNFKVTQWPTYLKLTYSQFTTMFPSIQLATGESYNIQIIRPTDQRLCEVNGNRFDWNELNNFFWLCARSFCFSQFSKCVYLFFILKIIYKLTFRGLYLDLEYFCLLFSWVKNDFFLVSWSLFYIMHKMYFLWYLVQASLDHLRWAGVITWLGTCLMFLENTIESKWTTDRVDR